ncbi:hypothetical protein GDO86_003608 [Hymenochirus boettgeri]|uniref:Fibronectin type-III domain-containing protein n=1 Tax=Hymenochirus boettgeri TaxID=247094 RepID=A0A8T2KAC9_9PIPI|nr:hypothetical protein GDO86_003608 [Hymenochirus boettgeri]
MGGQYTDMSIILKPPMNVTTKSQDFRLLIIWLPAPGNPHNVSYQVSYKIINNKWSKKKHACSNITKTECDLTCILKDYTRNYIVGIRALSESSKSKWQEMESIAYIFTVDPDAPTVQLTEIDKAIHITANVQTPNCIKHIFKLKYSFQTWLNDEPNKTILNEEMNNSEITLPTSGIHGNYCIAARTVFRMEQIKISPLSSPVCQIINNKAQNINQYSVWISIAGIAFLLAISYCCLKSGSHHKAKTPAALDFSNIPGQKKFDFETTFSEQYDKISALETKIQPSSNILLAMTEEYDNECSHCGYTEKNTILKKYEEKDPRNGNSICYKVNSLGKSLKAHNSDNSSTSNFSCEERENLVGHNLQRFLTLDDIKKKNVDLSQKENEETWKSTPNGLLSNQQLVIGNKTLNELLCVRIETLEVGGKIGQLENSDGEFSDHVSSDFEGSADHFNTDNEMEKQLYTHSNKQKLSTTGYEHRGYMLR